MDHSVSQFPVFAAAMIEQAKKDLISDEDRLALRAALYLFVLPEKSDDADLTTFTGLCNALDIDPDNAAKKIFNDMQPFQQERIRCLLKNTNYCVQK